MAVSPWAQVQDQQAPPPASVLAPVQMGDSSAPPVFASSTPAIKLAPQPPTPQQQLINEDQQRLEKVRWAEQNPWGIPDNHPGKLGKLAHVFSTLGNIAGDVFAPSVMERIPGTQAHMQAEENGLTHRLNTEIGDQSQNQYRGAEQAHIEAETPEVAPNAESTRALQGAETGHTQAETEALKNPPSSWKALTGMVGPSGQPIEYNERDGTMRLGGIEGVQQLKQPKPDSPEQQYIDEYQRVHKGASVADAERAYTSDTQKPLQTLMMVPNAQGGETAQTVRSGSTVAPGAQTAAGVNSVNTPTTQQRNVGAQAKLVTEQMPGLISEIQQNEALLGPVSGRWNEFMQGKVGMDNPEMAGLRADLLMMSSAVALMHARGRLPENLREEFDHAINAPTQTPANLIATLNHINQWTQANINAMGGGNNGASQSSPATGGPKVLKFNQQTGRLE